MRHIICNFYFGNGKKSISFDKHDHDYPVIVKNIYGESKWIIDEKEVVLKNQECIWFDKFVDHQSPDDQYSEIGMDADSISKKILKIYEDNVINFQSYNKNIKN